jgi:two-component sensor histidine kinase
MFTRIVPNIQVAAILGAAIALVACGKKADESIEHRSVVQVEAVAADTANTGACIRASLVLMIQAPDSSRGALAQCWQGATPTSRILLWHAYHEAMARVAYHRSDMLSALLHCDSALNHGSIRPDRVQEASIAVLQSRIFAWTGDFDAASTVLGRALALSTIAQDTAGMAESLEQLGWAHYRQDQFLLAKEQWSRSLELRRSIKDLFGVTNNLRWVGIALMDSHDPVEGALYYDSALYMARVLKDPYLLSCAHDNMGIHMDSALYYARIHGDAAHLHRIMYTTGQVLIRRGKVEEGMAYCDTVLAYARQTRNAVLERDALMDLGYGYRAKGMWKQALMLNDKAYGINLRVINPPATKDVLAKQSVLNEFRRRQIGDSLRYVRELEQVEGERALASLRAERNSILAWAIGLAALAVIGGATGYQRNKLRHRKLRHERDKARSELRALCAQMNPHFIFNALASINDYVLENESELASSFLTRFARLMRLVLENSRKERVSLAKDLEALQLYMELECLRSNNGFTHSIDVAAGIDPLQIMVPPLMIQPFVENAIRHGLAKKQKGHLRVSVKKRSGQLIVTVEDDGVGMKRPTVPQIGDEQTSLGTAITAERLAMLNEKLGMPLGFRYLDVPVGVCVEVTLPLTEGR